MRSTPWSTRWSVADRTVRAVITGSSAGAVRAFEETSLAAQHSADAIGRSTASTNASLAGLGKALGLAAVAGTAGMAIIGGASIKAAADFQSAMTSLVTGAGESQGNIAAVSQGILDMSTHVGTTASQLAQGMYMIESAGYHGAAGLDVLRAAAEGAKVGNADMATVADALTSSLNAYKGSGLTATQVTNDLVATVASGKMHMEDLAASLGAVLPAASAAGISLQDVTAAVATMTAQGTPAADATTYLRQTILMLENPSSVAAQAMKNVGLTADQVSDSLREKGLSGTLAMITDHLAKKFPVGSQQYISSLADMVGGTKSMQAALELTGPNMATFQANAKAIGAATKGAGGDVHGFAAVQEDLNFKLDQAKASLEAVAIKLGDRLIPYLTQFGNWISDHSDQISAVLGGAINFVAGAFDAAAKAADKVNGMVDWFKQHMDVLAPILIVAATALVGFGTALAIQSLIQGVTMGLYMFQAGLAGVSAAEVGGTTASYAFGAALDFATGPIGLIVLAIAAIVAVTYELIQHWDQVKEVVGRVWGWISSFFEGLGGRIVGILSGAGNWLKDTAMRVIHGLVSGLEDHWADIIAWAALWPIRLPFLMANAGLWLIEAGGKLVGGFLKGAGEFFIGNVVPFLLGLPGRILGFVFGFDKLLVNAGYNLLVGLYNGAFDAFKWVFAWFAGLPGQIGHALVGLAGDVASVFKDAFNGMIQIINAGLRGMGDIGFDSHFGIPGFHVRDLFGGGMPQIPNLATGGIALPTPGGTLVRVAEAGKPEAIIPLDRGGMGGVTVTVGQIVVHGSSDPQATARAVRDELLLMARSKGLPSLFGGMA